MTCLDVSHTTMRSSPPRQYIPSVFCVVLWRRKGTQEHIRSVILLSDKELLFKSRAMHTISRAMCWRELETGECSSIPRGRKSRHCNRLTRLGRPEHRGAPPWPTIGAGRFAPPASTFGPEIRTSECTTWPACTRASLPGRLMTSSW